MVDYEAFDGGSFDAVDWVNAALQARAEGDSVDTHVSTVVMKLQLQSADVEDEIEEAADSEGGEEQEAEDRSFGFRPTLLSFYRCG